MKKILSLLMMFALAVSAWASETHFVASQQLVDGTVDGFTFLAQKNNGSTAPTYNTNGQDVRIYAKGTYTITNNSGNNITNIVFNISTAGKKRLAAITANTGTVATQALGDETVTWNGEASTVTFTVGDKAEYGSDGNTKAGQLCFNSIDITYEGGTTITVTPPTFSPAAGEVEADTEVTISAPDAEMIIYTTDGTDPSYEEDNGDIYTEPIVVNQTMTIKAIAVDADENVSAIASATYTIAPQAVTCATIAEFNALADGTEFTFTGELTVSGQTGQYLYAQDNNKGILIYGNLNDNIKYNKLDVIPAGWKGKKTTYNGAPEATNLSNFAAATTQANLTAEEITIPNVTLENVFRYVIINEVTYTPGSGKNGSINDGEDDLATYNRFNIEVPNDNNTYNVIGITGYYNGAQFMPLEFVGYVEPSNEISTVAEFLALEPNTEFTYNGTLICVQNFVSGNNRYLYLADETGGIVVFNPSADTPEYTTTDIITGGWSAKKTVYKNLPEATNAKDFVEKTGNQNISPIELTIEEAQTSELLGAWVVIKNVLIRQNTSKATTQETTGLYVTSDGNDELEIYSAHTAPFELPEGWEGSERYDVYGILGVYNDTRQIMPTGIGQNGEIITKIEEVSIKDIKSITYFDTMGRQSQKPFEGINIVVVEYSNGTKTVTKVIK